MWSRPSSRPSSTGSTATAWPMRRSSPRSRSSSPPTARRLRRAMPRGCRRRSVPAASRQARGTDRLARSKRSESSSAPLRGGVLRWVPGRIPLSLHAPGKAVERAAPKPSTALSRTPATQRSGVEGDPGPSARTRREAAPNSFRRGLSSARGRGLERFGGGPYVSPLVPASEALVPTAHLSDRGVVRVSGADSRTFLDGLVTCDLDKVEPDRPRFGALLTPQGKLLFDFLAFEAPQDAGGGFYLDCLRFMAPNLAKRLGFYK